MRGRIDVHPDCRSRRRARGLGLPGMIDVRDLRFAYPDGRVALDGLTLHVTAGESVGLIGPNGAGKTTLFLCLCGVLPVKAGAIDVAGLDPSDPRRRKELPRHVG